MAIAALLAEPQLAKGEVVVTETPKPDSPPIIEKADPVEPGIAAAAEEESSDVDVVIPEPEEVEITEPEKIEEPEIQP